MSDCPTSARLSQSIGHSSYPSSAVKCAQQAQRHRLQRMANQKGPGKRALVPCCSPPWINGCLPRAPLRLTWRLHRGVRGSLLLTTGTAVKQRQTESYEMQPTVALTQMPIDAGRCGPQGSGGWGVCQAPLQSLYFWMFWRLPMFMPMFVGMLAHWTGCLATVRFLYLVKT